MAAFMNEKVRASLEQQEQAPSPLELLGAAAEGAGYVSCKLKLEGLELPKLVAQPSLRIGLGQDVAKAVEKVAAGIPSYGVQTSLAGSFVEVGIALPSSMKGEDVVKKLGSSGKFVDEVKAALQSGCCKGATVSMSKEPALAQKGETVAKKSAATKAASKEDTTDAAKKDDAEAATEETTSTTAAATSSSTGSTGEAGATSQLLVMGCTVGGLIGAGAMLWNLL